MTDTFPTTDADHFDVPPWLLIALQPADGTATFQVACTTAAKTGLELARLRHASQRYGFSFASVPAYLRHLGQLARVPLEHVLRWADLSLDEPVGAAFARSWSLLARHLGVGLQEALWYLRLTFVEQSDTAALAMSARPTGNGDALVAAVAEVVATAVARWDDDHRARLRECEDLLRDDYGRAGQA